MEFQVSRVIQGQEVRSLAPVAQEVSSLPSRMHLRSLRSRQKLKNNMKNDKKHFDDARNKRMQSSS